MLVVVRSAVRRQAVAYTAAMTGDGRSGANPEIAVIGSG
jgi:hypothetical protein